MVLCNVHKLPIFLETIRCERSRAVAFYLCELRESMKHFPESWF